MNTNTLEQNQAIVDEYIKKHTKTVSPDKNPMGANPKDIESDNNTMIIKTPTKEEKAKQELEERSMPGRLLYENNQLLKSIDNKLSMIDKALNILLSHIQNIEYNMCQPF